MRRLFKRLLCAGFVSGAVGMVISSMPTSAVQAVELPSCNCLRNADILLLGSSTWRGRFLKMLDTKSDYLHVGMIDLSNDECNLIHADPKRGCVVRERINDYFAANKVETALILRVQCADDLAEKAIAFAREQSALARRFDNTFHYREGTGMYCTELVLLAWNSAQIELLPDLKVGDRVFPSRLIESEFVHPVYGQ